MVIRVLVEHPDKDNLSGKLVVFGAPIKRPLAATNEQMRKRRYTSIQHRNQHAIRQLHQVATISKKKDRKRLSKWAIDRRKVIAKLQTRQTSTDRQVGVKGERVAEARPSSNSHIEVRGHVRGFKVLQAKRTRPLRRQLQTRESTSSSLH